MADRVLDPQTLIPAVPVFPAGAVMGQPMATRMQKYEREAVLGVFVTAAVEAGGWVAIDLACFKKIAERGIPAMFMYDVLQTVPRMVTDGLLVKMDGDLFAPTPALLGMLQGCHMDYTFEADRLDVADGDAGPAGGST